MMKKINALVLIVILQCIVMQNTYAQDFHFSNLTQSRTFYNPAFCGNFAEDYQINSLYRNQYATVPVGYNSFFIDAETKFNKMATGIILINDKAGDASWQTTQFSVPISYKLQNAIIPGIDINFGMMPSFSFMSFDPNKLYFNKQFSGDLFDASLNNGESFNSNRSSYFNGNMGVCVSYNASKKIKFNTGVALKSNSYFTKKINSSNNVLSSRTNIYASVTHFINEVNYMIYEVSFSSQKKYKELLVNTNFVHSFLNNKKISAFKVGTGIRANDAILIYTGFNFNKVEVNFCYDINYSGFRKATNSNGAIEVGVSYRFYKIKEVKSNLPSCPVYF